MVYTSVVKVATTIQLSPEEDQKLTELKFTLKLPNKKAVVLAGIHYLKEWADSERRRDRLASLSKRLRTHSLTINREWAPLSSATKVK